MWVCQSNCVMILGYSTQNPPPVCDGWHHPFIQYKIHYMKKENHPLSLLIEYAKSHCMQVEKLCIVAIHLLVEFPF